jgi:hypothetical protein
MNHPEAAAALSLATNEPVKDGTLTVSQFIFWTNCSDVVENLVPLYLFTSR